MRLICEHPDGRRVGVDEISFDHPSGNPFNFSSRVVRDSSDEVTHRPARPQAEHQSLKAEGFVAAWKIDDEGHEVELSAAEKRRFNQ